MIQVVAEIDLSTAKALFSKGCRIYSYEEGDSDLVELKNLKDIEDADMHIDKVLFTDKYNLWRDN